MGALATIWRFGSFAPMGLLGIFREPSDEGRVAQMDGARVWTRSRVGGGTSAGKFLGFFGMLNLLRLTEPRSGGAKAIWATRPESLGYCRTSLQDFIEFDA